MNRETATRVAQSLAAARRELLDAREEVCSPYPDGIVPGYVRAVLNDYDDATDGIERAVRAVHRLNGNIGL